MQVGLLLSMLKKFRASYDFDVVWRVLSPSKRGASPRVFGGCCLRRKVFIDHDTTRGTVRAALSLVYIVVFVSK